MSGTINNSRLKSSRDFPSLNKDAEERRTLGRHERLRDREEEMKEHEEDITEYDDRKTRRKT